MVVVGDDGQSDNSGGHWESRTLSGLNDELLSLLGGTWSAPPERMSPGDLCARLESSRQLAIDRFYDVHPRSNWVWKDPRLCLLLPFWLRALEIEPVLVLAIRSPETVAASLMHRNGLGRAHALALWHRYASDALHNCADLPTVVVRYDELVTRPGAEVRRLSEALSRHGAATADDASALEEAAAAIDPTLRHHVSLGDSGATRSPKSHDRLQRLLNGLGRDYARFPRLELPSLDEAGSELLATHRRLDHARADASQARALVDRLESDLRRSEDALDPVLRLPTICCSTRDEFISVQGSELFADRYKLEIQAAHNFQHQKTFTLPGFCLPCSRPAQFAVDWLYTSPPIDATWLSDDGSALELTVPNWRERMLCPRCGMNNRQRAIAGEIRRVADRHRHRSERAPRLYFTEQITPMFRHISKHVPGISCVGSEYLGAEVRGGTMHNGIRHEDVEALSFGDDCFDLAVSCSVLEHVNEPFAAIRELQRIVRPGGDILLEVPFDIHKQRNVRRARRHGGRVEHLLPPEYHGDPMSDDGALVYFDFGWEFFDHLRGLDTCQWEMVVYWSLELGHLGGAQLFFRGRVDP